MSHNLTATPTRRHAVDGTAKLLASVVLLAVAAVAMILVTGPPDREDPLAERVNQGLLAECGPGLRVLRTEEARGVYAAPNTVPFRCHLYVDGRRAGQGTGVANLETGVWSLFYEYADRHAERPGTRRAGTISGALSQGLTASARTD